MDKILTAPDKHSEETCSICGSDSIAFVIHGKSPCYQCGNQINLCMACYKQLLIEMVEALFV